MRLSFAFALAVACFCSAALAQTPNPVVEHFRAYRAAMEQGNLAAASSEAEQALAASQARDGDGGRTAVLALNLANVRLMNHDAAGALQPAQRALALSQNAASGVDPRLANLIYGRAELALNNRDGSGRINTVLTGSLDGLPDSEIYAAAFDLGVWGMAAPDLYMARSAFVLAEAHAAGSPLGAVYGRGVARTGEGAVRFLDLIGPGSQRTMRGTDVDDVSEVMDDAVETLRPLTRWTTDTPTIGEHAYAEAVAWQAMLHAKLAVEWLTGDYITRQTNRFGDLLDTVGPADQIEDQCAARIVREDMTYPPEEQRHNHFGVVILLLRADGTGAITSRTILASRGSDAFPRTVQASWSDWRIERIPDAPRSCRLSGAYLAHIHFATS